MFIAWLNRIENNNQYKTLEKILRFLTLFYAYKNNKKAIKHYILKT